MELPDGVRASPSKPTARASWRHLFVFTRWQHWSALSAAVLAAIVSAGLKTILAVILGYIFQVVAEFGSGSLNGQDTLAQVSHWCLVLCGLGGATFLANSAMLATWIVFGELQAKSARDQIFKSLLWKEMEWYDRQSDGVASLLVRIETQIRELQTATSQVFGYLIFDLAVSAGSLIVAFYLSWKLAAILLASLPITFVVLGLVSRRLEPAVKAQKRELAKASKYASASITAIDLVKVYSGFDQEIWQYCNAIKASMSHYSTQTHYNALQMGYVKFWIISLFAGGFWFGVYLVNQGGNPGQILATFYATLTALQGIESLMPQWLVFVKGMSAGQSLAAITAHVQDGKDNPQISGSSRRPDQCIGNVELSEVSFAYPSNPTQLVLNRSSFFFPAGDTCFIVGRSGSGKSTVGNLLVGFYEPLAGGILLDGHPLQTLDKEWLRSQVTLIQQSSVLFNETFGVNVALGHRDPENVTKEEIKIACDTALLQSTLASMPEGLNTMVGPGGYSLSGGQKQRLALARARLRDSPVLILDEVTSGLDQASKSLVMEAIRLWRRQKTTIIITHDVTQIEDNDYVYVMDGSFVVQEGFRRVISRDAGGLFASLVESTNSAIAVGDADSTKSGSSSGMESAVQLKPPPQHSRLTRYFLPDLDSPYSRPGSRASFRDSLEIGTTSVSMMRTKELRNVSTKPDHIVSRVTASVAKAPDEKRRDRSQMRSRPSSRYASPSTIRGSIDVLELAGHTVQRTRIGSVSAQYSRDGPRHVESNAATTVKGANDMSRDPDKGPSTNERFDSLDLSLWGILKTVWPMLSLNGRWRLVAGIFMCFVVAGSNPGFAYCFAQLLSAFWATNDRLAAGQQWAIFLIVIAVIDGMATYASRYLMEHVGQAWVNALRVEALKRILLQPKPWFDEPRNSASRINECMDRNAEEMRNLVGRFAPMIVIVVVMVLTAVIWAISISWKLTLVALSAGPAIWGSVKALSITSTKCESACNKGAGNTSAVLTETCTNFAIVKALTLEKYFSRKHADLTASTFKLGLRRAAFTGPLYGVYQSVNFFLTALVFYYGTVLLARDLEVTAAVVLQVINLLLFCMAQVGSILGSMPQISASRATALQMLYYANLPEQTSGGSEGKQKLLVTPFPISLNSLAFAYPSRPTNQVLRGLSLKINAGTCTAIVGPSGCGKSTVLSILMGIYTPATRPTIREKSCQLTFADIPFFDVDSRCLRSMTAYVPQAPFLFPMSIAENIAYGLQESSPLRNSINIERAALAAGIHEFIVSLPDGYGTIVGDGGQALSGGQSQRLSVARALARQSRLIVMDEPTSALDAGTAEMVRQTIRDLTTNILHRGTAVVVVTHSRGMMRTADHIVVLDNGQVAEEGSYDDLWEAGGVFTSLIGDADGVRTDKETERSENADRPLATSSRSAVRPKEEY